MKLFHYTSVALAESILSSSISQGHLMQSDGEMLKPVVWLTTEPRSWGHGLTSGDETPSPSEIAHSERVQGGPLRNNRTADKTRIRIAVELDPKTAPDLMSFMEYAKTHESKAFAKTYGISARYKLAKLTPKNFQRIARHEKTMESTWWLSFSPVPTSAFIEVAIGEAGRFVPYVFEQHGRPVMRDAGFAIPSPTALESLQQIVPSSHRYELTKAILICGDPTEVPKVSIRGGGAIRTFDVLTADHLKGTDDELTPVLQGWINTHRAELTNCWNDAVELYFVAYPERRAHVPS